MNPSPLHPYPLVAPLPSTPELARLLQSSIPGAELVLLPDAAHFANAEQPEMFNKAVLEFLGAA